MMILLIDYEGSFTYNLVHALGLLGATTEVHRHDTVTVETLSARRPRALVLTPGSGAPALDGPAATLVRTLSGRIPLLGIGFGHLAIGAAWGMRAVPARCIAHGKALPIRHTGTGLYERLTSPLSVGCYHSLVLQASDQPAELSIDATSDDGLDVMGIRHRVHLTFGMQFHPESILTPSGKRLLRNFLNQLDG